MADQPNSDRPNSDQPGSMKPDRAPGSVWTFYYPMSLDKPGSYVRTAPGDMVQIVLETEPGKFQQVMIDRQQARMLAKRLNQCLDATTRRPKQ